MLKTRNGKETPVIKKEPEIDSKERARQEAEAARARAKQEKEAAARAKKEAEALARDKARQEAEAARERAIQAKKADKTAKMAAAWVKQELEADAKRKAKLEAEAARVKAHQEMEAANKAKITAATAKKEAEILAREKAKQEAEASKQSQQAAAIAKKEAEILARKKALQEAEALKKSQLAAATTKKEIEALAREKAKQEAETLRQSQQAAAIAKKEAEERTKEKVKQEAEALRQSQQATVMAKKEAEEHAKEKAKQEAEVLKQSQQAAAMAKKEAEERAKEKTKQEAETLRQSQQAAAMAKKEAEARTAEKAKQEAEALKQSQQAAVMAKKEAEALAKEKAKQEAEALRQSRQAAAMAIREAEAIAREKPPQRTEPTAKPQSAATWVKKEPETKVSRVPFFSGRSILIILVGIIIGAGLGLAYWIYNPFSSGSTVSTGTTGPSKLQLIGLPSDVPWKNEVKVQILSLLSPDLIFSRNMGATAAVYAAKASSLLFMQFLSNSLATDAPQYNHTTDELSQMITSKFDDKSTVPTIIIGTTAKSTEETTFLSTYIPTAFKKFLISEAVDQQQQDIQDVSNKIDVVKIEVVQATNDLNVIKQKSGLIDVTNDPNYVALNAKIDALDTQLKSEATALVTGGADQTIQAAIDQTMQQRDTIITSLTKAQSALKSLDLKYTLADGTAYSADLITLNAQINALESELNRLMVGDATTVGLATMIAQGMTSADTTYANAMVLIDQTSKSLVDTKQHVAVLQSQLTNANDLALAQDYALAQAKVDTLRSQLTDTTTKLASLNLELATNANQPTLQQAFQNTSVALTAARTQLATLESSYTSSSSVSASLEYQLAQAKVNDLNTELSTLTAKHTSLIANSTDSIQTNDSIIAGNPSVPVPVLPSKMRMRNALMIGAMLGIALAWVAVNFKWLRKSAFTKTPNTVKEDEL